MRACSQLKQLVITAHFADASSTGCPDRTRPAHGRARSNTFVRKPAAREASDRSEGSEAGNARTGRSHAAPVAGQTAPSIGLPPRPATPGIRARHHRYTASGPEVPRTARAPVEADGRAESRAPTDTEDARVSGPAGRRAVASRDPGCGTWGRPQAQPQATTGNPRNDTPIDRWSPVPLTHPRARARRYRPGTSRCAPSSFPGSIAGRHAKPRGARRPTL